MWRWPIDVSSMISRDALMKTLPVPHRFVKEHSESFLMSMGTFSLLWRVVPPSRSLEATADKAVATAMWPSARTALRIVLMRNVFPVPPGASTKKRSPLALLRLVMTLSNSCLCLMFNFPSFSLAFAASMRTS